MPTDHSLTAEPDAVRTAPVSVARWPAVLLVGMSLALVATAWPRLQASLSYLPVDTALGRYFDTREIPGEQLSALSRRAAEVVHRQPHHRYWYGLSLLHYLQALDPATPRWEREPSLRRSLAAGVESLKRSPVNPYAWYQVAQVRSVLGRPAGEVLGALEMSWLTGRVEPQLLLPRLELGAAWLGDMNDAQRAQWTDQAGLALRLKRPQLLAAMRAGRLDMDVLRQYSPPGLDAELEALEQGLGRLR